MEMIGNGIVIDFGNSAFLRTDSTGEIPEMVDCQRQIGMSGFTDRLAVVPCFSSRKLRQVFLNAVSDLIEDHSTFGWACFAPCLFCCVGCIKCCINIGCIGTCDFTQNLTIDRGCVVEIAARLGLYPFAANEIAITFGKLRLYGAMKFYLVHDIPPKDNATPMAFVYPRWRGSWEESPTVDNMRDQCVSIMRHISKTNLV